MGRPWRIEYEGGLYHVLSRGNEQRDIFYDDKDRQSFLTIIGEMAERYAVDVFAYVLMNNHYHLLLRTNDANLSRSMQWLALTYTRRFNNRHFRSGHLFQGRYKSIIIENDAYLMRLSCYIHRNPLRAKIVSRLSEYSWSSYKVYAYAEKGPDWLLTKPILSYFQSKDKHKAYRVKAQNYAKEEKRLWEDFRHGLVIGSKRFVDKIRSKYLPEESDKEVPLHRALKRSREAEEILKNAAVFLKCDLDIIKSSKRISKSMKADRDLLVYLIWQTCGLTNEETGKLFGMTYSAVRRVLTSMRNRLKDEPALLKKYSQFKM
jgi:putative transposase